MLYFSLLSSKCYSVSISVLLGAGSRSKTWNIWCIYTFFSLQKPVTSLHLDLATPEQANFLIEKEIVLGYTLHKVEPALLATSVTQSYKCTRFGHQAHTYQAQAQCTACGGKHARRDCQTPPETLTPKYANCKRNHPAWSKSCQKKQEAIQKVREVWLARPGRYITAPRLALPQTPSTQEKSQVYKTDKRLR